MPLSNGEMLSLISFTIFSLADLRFRLVPAIEWFFLGAMILGGLTNPVQVLFIFVAVAWGIKSWLPAWLPIFLLFYPATWPIMIAGVGVRKSLIGVPDLFALGGIACIFPWPAIVFSLLGFEFWRRFWVNRGNEGPIPAIPGLFLGLVAFVVVRYFFPVI